MQQRLAQEERIAVRLGGEALRELRWHRVTGDTFEQGLHLVRSEAVECDASHFDLALQLRQRLRERMAAVEVGLAIGADDEHVGAGRDARQGAQHADGGVVGPVQVFDDERDRAGVTEPDEYLPHGIVQPRSLGIGRNRDWLSGVGYRFGDSRSESGNDRRIGTERRADARSWGSARPVGQRLGERRVGHDVAVVAATDQHVEAVERRAHLRRQPRLADTGFSGDEYQSPGVVSGRRQTAGEQRSLAGPADIGGPGSQIRCAGRRLPADVEGRHRFWESLELEVPDRGHFVTAATAGEDPHDLGDQDVAALGGGAQS